MKILIILCISSVSLWAQQKLIVATYRYSDNDRVRNIQPFADYFAKTCGCATEVKSYESVSALLQAMDKKEPHIVFMNTFGYLMLKEKNQHYQTAAALQVASDKKSNYQSVIIANKSTGIQSLDNIKQKASNSTLLLVNPGSTSGNLVPRIQLASIGITDPESAFKKVTYSRNHLLTLKQVAESKADVGAFGSEEYEKALKMDRSITSKVNLVWTSEDIPLGPVVYPKDLSRKFSKCLEDLLLSLHEKNGEALESVKAGWTEAYPTDRFLLTSMSRG
jgi:phosphate/phosphite/phosphonate ABC transporter binding protein